jgi:fatty acid hydroxylase domain-containing protein 2
MSNISLLIQGDDTQSLYCYATLFIGFITIVITTGIFNFMDFVSKPKALRKYKTQPQTNEPPDWKKYSKAMLLITFNGTFVTIPLHIAQCYFLTKVRSIPDIHILPDIQIVVLDLFFCVLCYEVFFYSSHRLLHHKFFYSHIHKIHHEWQASISIIALYAHPLEFVIANLMPVAAGYLILGCHIVIIWIWIVALLVSTLSDHSGYHLPFLHSAEFHDFHHLK